MYAGAPLVLLVHAVQPDEVLLGMAGNLCNTPYVQRRR